MQKNAEKCKTNTALTSVNTFAFRSEILYLCATEVEIAPEIGVIFTFFRLQGYLFLLKNKYYRFYKVTYRRHNVTYRFTENRYCADFNCAEC